MSNDFIARARAILNAPRKGQPALPDESAKDKDVMALARAAASAPPKPPPVTVAKPLPAPRAEKVRLLSTCSKSGTTYIVIAERRDGTLRFVGHEFLRPGGGSGQMPGLLSGQYQIEANNWRCPVCHDAGAMIWFCDCERMKGSMHCGGSFNGIYRCACKREEPRQFVDVKDTQVRGSSVASTPRQSGSGDQRGHHPQLKQVGYERS